MARSNPLPSLITAALFAVVAACSGPSDPRPDVCAQSFDGVAHCSP